jgi:hypothetical protein
MDSLLGLRRFLTGSLYEARRKFNGFIAVIVVFSVEREELLPLLRWS